MRADLIAPLEIGPVLILRETSAGWGSGNWLIGAGLVNTDCPIAEADLPFSSREFHLHF